MSHAKKKKKSCLLQMSPREHIRSELSPFKLAVSEKCCLTFLYSGRKASRYIRIQC